MTELPDHSARGPSGGPRWLDREEPDNPDLRMGCPASVRLSDGAPDTLSIFAAEGTAAHWINELCAIFEVPVSEYLGHTDKHMPHPDGSTIVCDQEMVDGVQSFRDYVNSFPSDVTFAEIKVTYMDWVEDDGFGTADDIRILESEGLCRVTDLKYGKGVQVYAPWNVQLMLYALGAWSTFSHLYEWDRFILAINQPRLDHIDEWEISVKDLLEWANTVVRPGAELTRDPNAPIRPGEWCQFCRIKTRCRTRARFVMDISDGLELMSNEELALALPHLDAIRAWCNDVEQVSLSEVNKGSRVGGYFLAEGRSNRAWRDSEAVERSMRNYKFRMKEIFPPTLISPTQFEKLAGKKHPILKKHVFKPQGKPVLVPPGSRRKAYALSAETEFDETDLSDWEEEDLLG